MHIAQGRGQAACDKIRYQRVKLLVLGGITGRGKIIIGHSTGAGDPDRPAIVQRGRGHLFDHIEGFSVEHPDLVERMDLIVGFERRAVGQKADAFKLSAAAAEI